MSPPNGSDAESVAARRYTLAGLAWCTAVGLVVVGLNHNLTLTSLLGLGPVITAAHGGRLRTVLVALYALALSVLVGLSSTSVTHDVWTRVGIVAVSGVTAVWLATLRVRRRSQLADAQRGEARERRRRQNAEADERLYRLAGALAAAVTPDQVAETTFEAVRAELDASAGIFSILTGRGTLRSSWSFGSDAAELERSGEISLGPDHPMTSVVRDKAPRFVESVDELAAQWPLATEALPANDQRSLALLPLVVSDRAVGSLAISWTGDHRFDEEERSFLGTLAGQAGQALERARLALIELDDALRAARLQQLSSALARAATPEEVAAAGIAEGISALGARGGTLRVPDAARERLVLLAVEGEPGGPVPDTTPLAGTPGGEALLAASALYLSGRQDLSARFPGISARTGGVGDGAMVWLPMIGGSGPLGVLAFTFAEPKVFSTPERRFLETLAGQCAQSLERAHLFELERRARLDAEAARERLALLSEVTGLLNSSLDPTAVIEELADLIVGRLADGCAVLVATPGGLKRQLVRGRGLLNTAAEARLAGEPPVPFDGNSPAAVAFRTGQPQLATVTPEVLSEARLGADFFEGVSPTALAVPLVAGGRTIGVMSFIAGPEHPGFGPDEVSLAMEVAARAGTALDNAQQFQREREVAEVLQRAVLPQRLVEVSGLYLDAEYRPGQVGTYAGGDWYDAIALDDGRIFFSVGDVMGNGPQAAALMGQVRSALRAYAVVAGDPGAAIESVDRLLDILGEDRLITVLAGVIDPATGQVSMANAGHPPPLLVDRAGAVEEIEGGRSMILAAGVTRPGRTSHRFSLSPGSTLICYSDGLVERRGEVITAGVARLADEVTRLHRSGPGPQGGWASRLADALSSDYDTDDDVVVLAIHYTGQPGRDPEAGAAQQPAGKFAPRLELPSDVSSTTRARRWITTELAGLPEGLVQAAALLTSELVTNAVLHAGTDLVVSVHWGSDRVRVDVADRSPVLPAIKSYGREAATGRGLTIFSRLASSWGARPVPGGKVVWFELPLDIPVDGREADDGPPGDAGDRAGADDAAPPPPVVPDRVDLVDIIVSEIPVAALHHASQQYDELFREFRLIVERDRRNSQALPARLLALIDELGTRFAGFSQGADAQWQMALERGDRAVDLRFAMPSEVGPACERYDRLLDEADDYCRAAELITLPASAQSVALRRWFLLEFTAQVAGRAPTPWPSSPWAAGLPVEATRVEHR